jgi:hypothetical protein
VSSTSSPPPLPLVLLHRQAFGVAKYGKAHRVVQRNLDRGHRKEHVPLAERTSTTAPPITVVVMGPKGVGKTTLIKVCVRPCFGSVYWCCFRGWCGWLGAALCLIVLLCLRFPCRGCVCRRVAPSPPLTLDPVRCLELTFTSSV